MVAEINITGIYFFMPIFSFLFVFLIVYAVLKKTQILGDSNWVNMFVGMIISIIFMSFSTSGFSTEQYVRTIVPWFAVLFVCVFLVMLITALSTKDVSKIMTIQFAWIVVVILIIIFVISAIRVFNPVFDANYGITSGDKPLVLTQIWQMFDSTIGGGIALIIIAGLVAWVVSWKVKK